MRYKKHDSVNGCEYNFYELDVYIQLTYITFLVLNK
jgi:hypothetical protein